MSLHGITKGTNFEQIAKMLAQGEACGTKMYYALARLANEQGLSEVAETFIEAANQEATHAGFYSVLNGEYPQNFWDLVRGLQKAEEHGEKAIGDLAAKMREAGFKEAADEMEIFAKQEGNHGVILKEVLEKYKPEALDVSGKKIYVCACCGFEYVGDLDAESGDYVCPVCGMKKQVFKLKE